MFYHFRRGPGSCGYDGEARCHGLHEDDPKPLLSGWQAEEIGLGVRRTHVAVPGHGTAEGHVFVQVEVSRESPKARQLRPPADDDEADLRLPGHNDLHCVKEALGILARVLACHGENRRRAGATPGMWVTVPVPECFPDANVNRLGHDLDLPGRDPVVIHRELA